MYEKKMNGKISTVTFKIEDVYVNKTSDEASSQNSEDKDEECKKVIYPEEISSDFDTDLDIIPPEKEQKTNAETCIHIYKTSCSNLGNYPPQQKIIDTLDKPMMSLSSRSLGPTSIRPLCLALTENLKVETLNLDGVDLQEEGCKYVSEMLLENSSICRLNISKNGLGPIAAKYLSIAIMQSRFLQQLNLSENKFDFEAALSLSRAIAKNDRICNIDLSKNGFCSRSGNVIGSAIAENKKLEKLNLSWNEIRGKGAVAVFKGIMVNTCLKSIDLSWNGLGYEGTLSLCEALKRNRTLQTIDISNNRINWKAAEILSRALSKNTTLQMHRYSIQDVPVLSETTLLAFVINRQRPFQFLHGDVVHTPDVLGQRFVLQATAMQRLLAYMKRLGIRPVELLRGFDKSVQFDITKDEFIQRLKKCGVHLFKFEMDALANSIAMNGNINYKLVDAVKEEIYGERRLKIKERQKVKKIKEQHKRILDLNLPTEVVSTDDEELIVVTKQQGGTQIKKLPSIASTSYHSILSSASKISLSNKEDQISGRGKKANGISYSAPLGGIVEPAKKRKKKRHIKKQPVVKSWMSKVAV
ncbi:leucine-rich repeat-containing protein 74A-like [Mytilus californianus]|uniref:leucine-rich repeat-containing protein 74A-like n=1 Tax=Mytilus californianus TaxID=6549 RepID=UPI002247FDF5|nr:leucine-rich repeat-containing protein 74A-like [Mytilus californianus]